MNNRNNEESYVVNNITLTFDFLIFDDKVMSYRDAIKICEWDTCSNNSFMMEISVCHLNWIDVQKPCSKFITDSISVNEILSDLLNDNNLSFLKRIFNYM